uniref:Uncharacterized protein n=1 Tax=Rhizophora mucronata TaxID=61149 RepID=A0A2P2QRR3_RHIMU
MGSLSSHLLSSSYTRTSIKLFNLPNPIPSKPKLLKLLSLDLMWIAFLRNHN